MKKFLVIAITIVVVLTVTVLPVFAFSADTPTSVPSGTLTPLDDVTYSDLSSGVYELQLFVTFNASGNNSLWVVFANSSRPLNSTYYNIKTIADDGVYTVTSDDLTGFNFSSYEQTNYKFYVWITQGSSATVSYSLNTGAPPLELASNTSIVGSAGEFYKLIDVDYDDVLSGDVSVIVSSSSSASLIYTASATDTLGNFEIVANMDSGVYVLNSDNAPTVTISDGYVAILFLTDSVFEYRVRDNNSVLASVNISDFSRFILSPFYTSFSTFDLSSNYLQFAMLSILFMGIVWYIIKHFK